MFSDRARRRFGLALGFVLFVCCALGSASNAFAQYVYGRLDLAAPNPAVNTLTGDFNGDGRPDLAVLGQSNSYCDSNCPPGALSVFFGQPAGTFAAPVNTSIGSNPAQMIAADFNGDGRLDLALIYHGYEVQGFNTSSVSVLLGNDDGTFQPSVNYATGNGTSSVVAADFNGDGKLDLATANSQDGTVSILFGNGDGTFQPHFDYPANQASSLTAGDFNGDGKPDIATTSFSDSLMVADVLLNNGDGTFQAPVTYATGEVGYAIATTDLRGTGVLDLVVTGTGRSSMSILLGNGDGTFQAHTDYSTSGVPGLPVFADFNGDGKLDVAVPTGVEVGVFLGNGDGTLQSPSSYALSTTGSASTSDFNGDGKPDLAVTTSGGVSVLIGRGDGTLATSPASYPTASMPGYLVTADFNNDGKLDFAVTAQLEISILLGNGDGTFQAHMDFDTGSLTGPMASADFNGDGKSDLAVLHPQAGTVEIFLSNGDGTFQAGSTYATGNGNIVTADFNGDGKTDLAVAAGTAVSILLGNGDGTFQPQVSYTVPNGVYIGVGDFNGDGKLDLAAAGGGDPIFETPGTVSVLLGNGGTFQAGVTYTLLSGTTEVVIGDFNGDGKLDLLSGGDILLGNGDGTFQAAQPIEVVSESLPPGMAQTAVAVTTAGPQIAADINGDGRLDLAGGSSVSLGNGDGTFEPAVGLPLNNCCIGADFNGDGALDLAEGASNAIEVLLNSAVIGISSPSIGFGGQGVGTTSTPQVVTVSNPGSAAFSISSIVASGSGFTETNNCGSTLVATATCTINVTFTPAAVGAATVALTLTDSVQGSPQVITLSGTGISGPFASFSPASLNFGGQDIGVTSPAQSLTLTNTGDMALSVTAITVSGDFAASNNCPASLAAGASCTVSVTFTPTTAGSRTGSITVTDNAGGSPQSASLVGTGAIPVVSLAPASLTFARQNQASTSAPQSVTLTNTGDGTLTISTIAASGDFSVTNACGASVAVGASCTISVTFKPTVPGTRTGSITITDNATPPTQTIALSGTGVTAPEVSFSPASLTFAPQEVGTASPVQKVTLTNTGAATLNLTSVAGSGDFDLINDCAGSIKAGGTCSMTVIFEPKATGALSGAVTVTDNAAGSPQSVALAGTGTEPSAALAPGSVSFAAELTGQSSGAHAVTLTNSGAAALAVSAISFSGADASDFSQQNSCGSSVPAGATCTINVTFKPAAGGARSATLTVADNATGSPQAVALTGTGNDFTLGLPSGTSGTATITAGQTADYTLSAVSLGGLTGSVSLTCSGAPAESTCSISPGSVPVGSGITARSVTVAVATTARSRATPRRPKLPPVTHWPLSAWWLVGLVSLAALVTPTRLRGTKRYFGWARPDLAVNFALILMLASVAVLTAACGGGSSSSTSSAPTGTPAGTYTITLSGIYTSGSATLQHNVALTLVVQ